MGTGFSLPVPDLGDNRGYTCMVIRPTDRFRLLHASDDVVDMVTEVAREVSGDHTMSSRDVCGSQEFKFRGRPFANCSGKEASALGKRFAAAVMAGMLRMGYQFIISAELSFFQDHSTWFFAKPIKRIMLKSTVTSEELGPTPKLCLLTLRAYDSIYVMNYDEENEADVFAHVKSAVEDTWSKGVQKEEIIETRVGKVRKLKLKGTPWSNKSEKGAEGQATLVQIIGRLGSSNWKLLTATNLKGFLASLVFVYDGDYFLKPVDLAMLSPHSSDRLRLVNFGDEEDRAAIRKAVREVSSASQENEPEEREYSSGCGHEIKLNTGLLDATGKASVASRRLVCRTMETLAKRGWSCHGAVTVSLYDRSTLIFQRATPMGSPRAACLALSVNNELRLLDFPEEDRRALRAAVIRGYLPGIERERQGGEEAQGDGNCLELRLRGEPFGDSTSYGLHGRSMLTGVLRLARERGWRLAASADVSANRGHDDSGTTVDVHSWFFIRDLEIKISPAVSPSKALPPPLVLQA